MSRSAGAMTEGTAVIDGASPAAVLRANGKTFSLASRFLGSIHAARAARLYAFCRFVDDVADASNDDAVARSDLDRILRDLRHGWSSDGQIHDFLALCTETGLDPTHGMTLVTTVQRDLDQVLLEDRRALVRYAYGVAGVVGLMMCAVLDVEDERALPFAIDLGIAMQLTNIARDVHEDARMRRRYIPGDWLQDLAPEQILAGDQQSLRLVQAATRQTLSLAEDYYRSAEFGMGYLPARARLAIFLAGSLYRDIGRVIAASNYKVWNGRAFVSTPRKAAIVVAGALAFVLQPSLHLRHAPHCAELHRDLDALPCTDMPATVSGV